MSATKILWGQVLAVALIVLAGVWGATQWTAHALAYQSQLGPPWFMLGDYPLYPPPAFFWWWFSYDGYGLKAFLIAQSLNQIEKAYGPNNAILDNCHVRVSFATNDERTAKRVSDALGTATEMRAMKNYAGHRLSPWLGHLMVSRSETARQLLTPGEVMQLPPTDEIVMVSGVQPIRGTKARYYEDPRLKARILKPPKSIAAPIAPPDDWSRLAPITAAAAAPSARTDDDLANGGIRREPELQRHEDVAPKSARPQREFSFGEGGDADADAARNRRLNDQMSGAAQRASLDPGDGIVL